MSSHQQLPITRLSSGNHRSTSCLCGCYSAVPHWLRVMQYFSFCHWLISLRRISSNVINSRYTWQNPPFRETWFQTFKTLLYRCMHTSHFLYAFICLSTFMLLPCLQVENSAGVHMGMKASPWHPSFNSFWHTSSILLPFSMMVA